MIVMTRCPVRVSFFGGGTDFPDYFQDHPGAVLGSAINQYCYSAVSSLPTCFSHNVRVSYSELELVRDANDVRHPLVRSCLQLRGIDKGVEINYFADVPSRSGLGTSSSFTAGLLLALASWKGLDIDRTQLARESIQVERDMVGDLGGWQDQWFAVEGGLRRFDFHSNGSVSVTEPALVQDVKTGLCQSLRLFYTGLRRDSSEVIASRVASTGSHESTFHRIYQLVDEGERLLGSSWDPQAFGGLLDETWRLKRSLSTHVTKTQIDEAYAAARKAGATGGKLLGAGGGGFLLLCVPPERLEPVRAALGGLYEVPFQFSKVGATVIFRES